jgi:hypothetical protein
MECKKSTNMQHCNCSYPCDKKGMCCDCVAYHRKRGELPACYFSNEVEKTYDRSIQNYLKTHN